jgi:hypothetical protein
MYDSKIELSDRIHTFEALSVKDQVCCCSVDSNVPDIIHLDINTAIMEIKVHLAQKCSIDLKNATFYFKYDKNDTLYLINVCGIQASVLGEGE